VEMTISKQERPQQQTHKFMWRKEKKTRLKFFLPADKEDLCIFIVGSKLHCLLIVLYWNILFWSRIRAFLGVIILYQTC
jgi:hypothetical protein